MKSPEFFIEKATELISEIDVLLADPAGVDSYFSHALSNEGKEEKSEYVDRVDPIFTRSQLMFGEFDNNEPFIEKIKGLKNKNSLFADPIKMLAEIKSLLELFVDHVREYRVETAETDYRDKF